MQDNTITLSVDPLNDGNPENRVFNRDRELPDISTYTGPGHTVAAPVTMQMYRTAPRRVGTYPGNAKSKLKFTFADTVQSTTGDDLAVSRIWELSSSLPVGVTRASIVEDLQHILAMIDSDDGVDLFDLQRI